MFNPVKKNISMFNGKLTQVKIKIVSLILKLYFNMENHKYMYMSRARYNIYA